jgi:hypothetical protein
LFEGESIAHSDFQHSNFGDFPQLRGQVSPLAFSP